MTGVRFWLALLLVPLVAVPTIAFLVLSGESEGSRLPIAQGAIGGTLHPVAGNFRPDDTKLETCDGDFGCLEQAFGNIAYREGPKVAMRQFEARIEKDAAVQHDCHRIAHTIGSAALALYDGNVASTFAAGDSTCASGYYHGILERAFVGVSTKRDLARVAYRLCDASGIRRRGFLDYQCRHGLGHGFMIQSGYDLPLALSLCSGLGTRWDELTCTSGAFMENSSTRFGFRSRWLDHERPLYPCTAIETRHKRSCFLRATTWALQFNDDDFEETARLCESAGRWATFCFRGFGRDAVVDARYLDVDKSLELCKLAGAYRAECLYGAARTFSDGSAFSGVRQAARFCARAPAADRDACAAGYGILVGLLFATDERRRVACASVLPAHADSCTTAAIAEVRPDGRGAWG